MSVHEVFPAEDRDEGPPELLDFLIGLQATFETGAGVVQSLGCRRDLASPWHGAAPLVDVLLGIVALADTVAGAMPRPPGAGAEAAGAPCPPAERLSR